MPGRGRGRVVSHQEDNCQGIVLWTHVVPLQVSFLALRSVSVTVTALLQPWYPAGWRGGSQGIPQGCWAISSCSPSFPEALAGDRLQCSDPEDFASFISFGLESVQARGITYKPSSCQAKALPQEKTKDP